MPVTTETMFGECVSCERVLVVDLFEDFSPGTLVSLPL